MHCRESAWFFVVVVFTATIAAPTSPTPASKWLQFAKSPKFQQYNATLLNPELMPFLSTCYNPSCCNENDAYQCSLYFDAVAWAEERHFNANVTKEIVAGIARGNVTEFCPNLTTAIATISSSHKMSSLSESLNGVSCIIACGVVATGQVRQECSVSFWLLNAVANNQFEQTKKLSVGEPPSHAESVQPTPPIMPEQIAKVPQKPTAQQPEEGAGSVAKSENTAMEIQSMPNEHEEPLIPESNVKSPQAPVTFNKQHTDKQSENSATAKQEKTIDAHPDTKSITKPENVAPAVPTDPNNAPKPSPPTAVSKTVEATATVPGKVSTESSPAIVPPDFERKMPDEFDDDDAGDQTDEYIEKENTMVKVDSPDNSQSTKIESPIPNHSRDDQYTVNVDHFKEEPSSNFFYYFLFGMFACILAYVVYNNKSKILALLLEGRRAQSGRGGRRKHTAAYRKLDSNLEEAIMSSAPSGRTSQIIY